MATGFTSPVFVSRCNAQPEKHASEAARQLAHVQRVVTTCTDASRLAEAWCALTLLMRCPGAAGESASVLLWWSATTAPFRVTSLPAVCSLARDLALAVVVGEGDAGLVTRALCAATTRLALHSLAGSLAGTHDNHVGLFARRISELLTDEVIGTSCVSQPWLRLSLIRTRQNCEAVAQHVDGKEARALLKTVRAKSFDRTSATQWSSYMTQLLAAPLWLALLLLDHSLALVSADVKELGAWMEAFATTLVVSHKDSGLGDFFSEALLWVAMHGKTTKCRELALVRHPQYSLAGLAQLASASPEVLASARYALAVMRARLQLDPASKDTAVSVGRVLVVCAKTMQASSAPLQTDVLMRAADQLASLQTASQYVSLGHQLDGLLFPPEVAATLATAKTATQPSPSRPKPAVPAALHARRAAHGDAGTVSGGPGKGEGYFARHLRELQQLVLSQPDL